MRRIGPYLKLAARAAKANVGRVAFPFKLTFCITYWCNYRCTTCNIWKLRRPIRRRTIARAAQHSRNSSAFAGGCSSSRRGAGIRAARDGADWPPPASP